MKLKLNPSKIVCIILKENKSISIEQVKKDKDSFRHDNNVYFLMNDGSYINSDKGLIFMIFLEGISTPISHKFIKYKTIEREFTNDFTGVKEKHKLRIIDGLRFDSKAISIILNQKLAEMFTRIPMDMPNLLLALLLIANVVLGIINIGMWFT